MAEDEKYMRMTGFYANQCSAAKRMPNNQCSENRNCENTELSSGEEPFIGHTLPGECSCPSLQQPQNSYGNPIAQPIGPNYRGRRYKRQTNEVRCRVRARRSCRVLRTRKGGRRRFCDKQVVMCPNNYRTALKMTPRPPLRPDACTDNSDFKDPACDFLTGF